MTTNYIQFKAKGICTRKEDFSEDVEDFMIACAKGDNKSVEQGLVNMNPDVIDNDGYTPLMLAVWGGHFKIVKNLVDAGAAIDTCDNKGNTALMLSAWRGDFEISKYLVNNGASLTIRNWRDSTALIFAAAHGRPKVFSMLLEREEVISFDDTVTLLTYTIYKRFESEAALKDLYGGIIKMPVVYIKDCAVSPTSKDYILIVQLLLASGVSNVYEYLPKQQEFIIKPNNWIVNAPLKIHYLNETVDEDMKKFLAQYIHRNLPEPKYDDFALIFSRPYLEVSPKVALYICLKSLDMLDPFKCLEGLYSLDPFKWLKILFIKPTTITLEKYGVYTGNKNNDTFTVSPVYAGQKDGYKLVISNFNLLERDCLDLTKFKAIKSLDDILVEQTLFLGENSIELKQKVDNNTIVVLMGFTGESLSTENFLMNFHTDIGDSKCSGTLQEDQKTLLE